jgi:competence protein ComEC
MFKNDIGIVPLFTAACTWFFTGCGSLPGPPEKAQSLEVYFVDVGQGDAVLLRLPGGKHILYDLGNRDDGLADALAAFGVDSLEAVLVSHVDLDHFGAHAALRGISVNRWYLPETPAPDPAWQTLRNVLDASGAVPETLFAGDSLLWPGGVEAEVLWPPAGFDAADNERSLVLRVSHAGRRLLLTGDIEGAAEAGLLRSGRPLSADLLKVAHHGSRTSSSLPLLAAVSPRYAVISCDSSVYGHPHRETLAGLQRFMEPGRVLRTDVEGTIGFEMGMAGLHKLKIGNQLKIEN